MNVDFKKALPGGDKNHVVSAIALFFAFSLIGASAFAQTQTIDFEGLIEGQVVSSVMGDGGFGPIQVSGKNAADLSVNSAVIFDSDCPGGCSGRDPDLGSPNETFGGPGRGLGGEAGMPYENDTAMGNILIIHERPSDIIEIQPGVPGVADPDDDAGITSITLIFPEPVTIYSFDMIDRENNESQNVELLGPGDVMLGMFGTPATGDNGQATMATDSGDPGSGTEGVVKLVMNHKGSGGLDNVIFKPMDPPGGGCSLTPGFWKTHPEAWPVDQLTLGGVLYTQAELLDILNTDPKGDKSIIMAHHLIAAKLNVANGSDPTDVSSAIADADQWLMDHGGVGSGQKQWDGGEPVKNTMDAYNNGSIGPGHCDDVNGDLENASSAFFNLNTSLETPTSFGLRGNYPNPFNPQTTITFGVKETAHVRLSVYDMLGRELEVLVNSVLQAGTYDAAFDAGDLPSGTYLYRLVTPEGAFTSKMVLAK